MTNLPVFDTSLHATPCSAVKMAFTSFGFCPVLVPSVFTSSPWDMALAPFAAFIAFMAFIAFAIASERRGKERGICWTSGGA